MQILEQIIKGIDISSEQISSFLDGYIAGEISNEVAAAFLVSLRIKGETAEELFGFVQAMGKHSTKFHVDGMALDTCGTGGDKGRTFNVSSLTAITCAAMGIPVVKHGNRSVTGKCGSADFFEELGVPVYQGNAKAIKYFRDTQFIFLFAPLYHPAMKHFGPIRKALGVRTTFNLIGPLLNPAPVTHQIIGVYSEDSTRKVAEVLVKKKISGGLVFHGHGGADELMTTGSNEGYIIQNGKVEMITIDPQACGIPVPDLRNIEGGDMNRNLSLGRAVINGKNDDAVNLVSLNAGAASWIFHGGGSLDEHVMEVKKFLKAKGLKHWLQKALESAQ